MKFRKIIYVIFLSYLIVLTFGMSSKENNQTMQEHHATYINSTDSSKLEENKKRVLNLLNTFALNSKDSLPLYRALDIIDSAITLYPSEIGNYCMRIDVLFLFKKYEEINENLNTVFSLGVDSLYFVETKGLVYDIVGKLDSAIFMHEKAIELYQNKLDPADTMKCITYTYSISIHELFLNRKEKGIQLLENLMERYPPKQQYIWNLLVYYDELTKEEYLRAYTK